MVGMIGIAPTRSYDHQPLKLTRLLFRHMPILDSVLLRQTLQGRSSALYPHALRLRASDT